jgi:raffinose/stachyose/melibiose transport system permease protein
VPGLQTFFYSLFYYRSFVTRRFIGLGNYLSLFTDRVFRLSLWHNLLWSALTVVIPLSIGLVLAVLVTKVRGRVALSAMYFLPVTVPLVVGGVVWKWIYNPIFGLLNYTLKAIGLGKLALNWLADTDIAFYALFVTGTWTYFGFCVLIFMNALQSVDENLYEAAKIDGATELQLFFHITIPSLRTTINFLIIWSTIGAMKFFDLVYVMTRGGPGHATEIVGTYIFELAFRQQKVGYASSAAMVLLAIILLLTYLTVRTREQQ